MIFETSKESAILFVCLIKIASHDFALCLFCASAMTLYPFTVIIIITKSFFLTVQ